MQPLFPYDGRTLQDLVASISEARLRRYLAAAADDVAQALRLYAWNTALSEALYGPIQGLEVTLRNKIHDRLTTAVSPAWYEDRRLSLRFAQIDQVQHAQEALRRSGKPIEPGRVVAELSFGFWVGLFSSKYENSLWRPHLRRLFINAPAPLTRRDAHQPLEGVRELRNRIAHHEPVFHLKLTAAEDQILTVLGWLCPATSRWIAHHSRFAMVHAARP